MEVESAVFELTAPRFDVVFPSAKRRVGDSTLAGVHAAVDASLADPGVDLVLAVGPMATTFAGRRDSLPKPMVGVFALDPGLQGARSSYRPTASGSAASGI